MTISLDRGRCRQDAVDAKPHIHRRTTDRSLRSDERQSADSGEESCGHIDASDPAMHGGSSGPNLFDELNAAEREDHPTGREMQTDRARSKWRVVFIESWQPVVPLRDVAVNER